MTFDAEKVLTDMREEQKVLRKTGVMPKSRLDRFAFEIHELRRAGAKPAEIQRWLRTQRIKVVLSTVTRWLQKHE